MAAQIVFDLGCEPPEVEITSGALDDKSGLRVSVLSRDISHHLIGRKRRENTHAGGISREQRIREYVYMVIRNRHAALTYCSARSDTTSREATPFMLARSSMSVVTIALAFAASNSRQNEETRMAPGAADGIISKPSNHSVDQTVDKLKSILDARGVTLFALVDHSGEAAKAGLNMRPTKLLIFGNPRAGTPVMLAAPSIAIDLPLKILVWEDARGRVWLSYNDPAYLQRRHGIPRPLLQNIAAAETLAALAAQ